MKIDYSSFLNSLGAPYLAVILFVLIPLVQLSLAVAVAVDSRSIVSKKGTTVLLPWWLWSLATLTMGFIVIVAYWLCHYSKLSQDSRGTNSDT